MAGKGIFDLIVRLDAENGTLQQGIDKASSGIKKFNIDLAPIAGAVAGAFAADKVIDFAKECVTASAEAEGVRNAFNALNKPGLLDELRKATRGTASDLTLMKTAVNAKNLGIPINQLSTYLAFASRRAKDTGQSVDYLVESIITGIGRQSPLILDNLGLSAKRISTEFQKSGDFGKAVGKIIQEEMDKAGDSVDTTGDKIQRMSASWDNFKEAIGSSVTVGAIFDQISGVLDNMTKLIDTKLIPAWQKFLYLFKFGGSKDVAEIEKRLQVWKDQVDLTAQSEDWLHKTQKEREVSLTHLLAQLKPENTAGDFVEFFREVEAYGKAKIKEMTDEAATTTPIQGLLELYKAQLQAAQEAQQKATTSPEVAGYNDEIKRIQQKIDFLTNLSQSYTVLERKERELKDAQYDLDNSKGYLQYQLYSQKVEKLTDEINLLKESMKQLQAIQGKKVTSVSNTDAANKQLQAQNPDFLTNGKVDTNKLVTSNLTKERLAEYNQYMDAITQRQEQFLTQMQSINEAVSSSFAELAENIGTAIGTIMSGGEVNWDYVFLKPIADLLTKTGEAMIAYATGMIALRYAITNPYTALAAGVAMVALGAALSSSISSSLAASTGSSTSSSSTSSSLSTATYTPTLSQEAAANNVAITLSGEAKVSGEVISIALTRYTKNSSKKS